MNKLTTDPLRIIHGAVEETTDWVYSYLSLLSDLIFEDEEESEKGIANRRHALMFSGFLFYF